MKWNCATDALDYEAAHEHLAPLFTERPAVSEAISGIVAAQRQSTADALSRAGQDDAAAEAAIVGITPVYVSGAVDAAINDRPSATR